MLKKNSTLLPLFLLLFTFSATAQNLKINLGLNIGMSQLFHDTRFETTPLHDLYSFTAISHRPDDYSWEEFEKDYGIRTSFIQPRFGVSAHFTYKDWPLMASVEAMSSPSSYQKMAYGFTVGIGKEFYSYDDYYFSFLGGYKFVKDNGFGATTVVNSIGNDEAREYASTFFNPENPLGTKTGNLFTLRGGLGRELGEAKIIRVGVEAYGELDLTAKTKRQSRMTNYGAQFFLRFKL
ncbi:MAG: hypothetical protein DYG98_16455 [Haliscomenobacteraceae bacterium CHB4]|nr:hypothetical protein [Saprospiraceae bacterium]MCE7924640.1 hypothetical protein [Haliscomenobacteraceae bacterium CHB4]